VFLCVCVCARAPLSACLLCVCVYMCVDLHDKRKGLWFRVEV